MILGGTSFEHGTFFFLKLQELFQRNKKIFGFLFFAWAYGARSTRGACGWLSGGARSHIYD